MDKELLDRIDKFPRTRYMGSKQKLLKYIYNNVKDFKVNKVLDAFSGSGAVSFLFKVMGKEVHSNDFMMHSYMIAKATIENNKQKLNQKDIDFLLKGDNAHNNFISKTFKDIFFVDGDNKFLDQTYANVSLLRNSYKKSLALAALARACVKKRPRGIFTYTGMRYDDGRKDIRLSLKEHFLDAIEVFNSAVIDNGKENNASNKDVFKLGDEGYDLVYIDPPYCSLHSDNDYSRRYHFVEGLMSNWSHIEINHSTKTKKFNKFKTPFDSKSTVYYAFDRLFDQFKNSILVVSYSSNSLPTLNEMVKIMKKHRKTVKVKELSYKYSFGNQKIDIKNNKVKEYLFIGY